MNFVYFSLCVDARSPQENSERGVCNTLFSILVSTVNSPDICRNTGHLIQQYTNIILYETANDQWDQVVFHTFLEKSHGLEHNNYY